MGNENSSQNKKESEVTSNMNGKTDEDHAKAIKDFFGSPELNVGRFDDKAKHIDPKLYDYPFENLVLEGGGCKGVAYAGVLKCLEENNILPNIKRFAGASAGAMAATFFALGYTSKEMEELLAINLQSYFEDGSKFPWEVFSNVKDRYGLNPAKKFYDWLSEKIAAKTSSGKRDLTFDELYKERGVELCVVSTNVNLTRTKYCHPKTTPDMPIRDAVRMSMSIPGYFEAKFYSPAGISQQDVYVDGGVLNNYPIDCFDGWGLSMDEEHAFIKMLTPMSRIKTLLKNMFEDFNHKSMGCILYDESEKDILRYNCEKRQGAELPKDPDSTTALHKRKTAERRKLAGHIYCYNEKMNAVNAFLDALNRNEDHEPEYIGKTQLGKALEELSVDEKTALFGEKRDVNSVMASYDTSGDGKISLVELVSKFEQIGLKFRETIYGIGRKEINGLWDFTTTLYDCVSRSLADMHLKAGDELRTVGINTGHVGTLDFDIEEADRKFAYARGYNATDAFLRYYAAEKQMAKRGTLAERAASINAAFSSNGVDI